MQIPSPLLPATTQAQPSSACSRFALIRSMTSQVLCEKWSQLRLCAQVTKNLLNQKKTLIGASLGALGVGAVFLLISKKTEQPIYPLKQPHCSPLQDPRFSQVSTSCEASLQQEESQLCGVSNEENPSGVCFASEAPDEAETFFNEFWSWFIVDSSSQAIRTPLSRPPPIGQLPLEPRPVAQQMRTGLKTSEVAPVGSKQLSQSEMVAWIHSFQEQDDGICLIPSKELVIFRP